MAKKEDRIVCGWMICVCVYVSLVNIYSSITKCMFLCYVLGKSSLQKIEFNGSVIFIMWILLRMNKPSSLW